MTSWVTLGKSVLSQCLVRYRGSKENAGAKESAVYLRIGPFYDLRISNRPIVLSQLGKNAQRVCSHQLPYQSY